eukprot:jgi/Botrbrau1/15105/Bobra.0240s0006.1
MVQSSSLSGPKLHEKAAQVLQASQAAQAAHDSTSLRRSRRVSNGSPAGARPQEKENDPKELFILFLEKMQAERSQQKATGTSLISSSWMNPPQPPRFFVKPPRPIGAPLVSITRTIKNPKCLTRLGLKKGMVEDLLPPGPGSAADPVTDDDVLEPTDEYRVLFHHYLGFLDEDEQSYDVKYECFTWKGRRHFVLTVGWDMITKCNGVVVGDSIVLERWGEDRFELRFRVEKAEGNSDKPSPGPEEVEEKDLPEDEPQDQVTSDQKRKKRRKT